jgi:N-acetylmuramic acid 6-phosphate etherase
MEFTRTTESESLYQDIDKMSILETLQNINREDQKVAESVARSIPQIDALVTSIVPKMKEGGRLFYIGAGTSGRLGIVDASECPPTYGVPYDMVIGIIAGGDSAIRKAVEFAEDSSEIAWKDLSEFQINELDTVVGIAASGTTPYVLGGLSKCNSKNINTGCIVCNSGSPIAKEAKFPIEVVVGPEFITGSTRMKSGTAQKLVLNMLTTSVMIQLGRVKGNRMVDMQLSNNKLVDRGTKMIMNESNLEYQTAKDLLLKHGSVRDALNSL